MLRISVLLSKMTWTALMTRISSTFSSFEMPLLRQHLLSACLSMAASASATVNCSPVPDVRNLLSSRGAAGSKEGGITGALFAALMSSAAMGACPVESSMPTGE